MDQKEFDVEFVWDKCPAGLLLREDTGRVMLEQHFDDNGKNIDVICIFGEDVTLFDECDLRECIAEARRYEPDTSIKIFVKSLSARNKEKNKKQKMELLASNIERSRTHPWDYLV